MGLLRSRRLRLVVLTGLLVTVATFAWARPAARRDRWVARNVATYRVNDRLRSLDAGTCQRVLEKARSLITPELVYDPAYVSMPYPMGDVPATKGVCADVIVRALRAVPIDLQAEVHRDMKAAFDAYPNLWSMSRTDASIDHRRVPNLMTWFSRHRASLAVSKDVADYAPCDVVAWDLGRGVTHIGLVSDRKSAAGTPLVIHHIGGNPTEENVLFERQVIGHYAL